VDEEVFGEETSRQRGKKIHCLDAVLFPISNSFQVALSSNQREWNVSEYIMEVNEIRLKFIV
jgi:hypothetical protein